MRATCTLRLRHRRRNWTVERFRAIQRSCQDCHESKDVGVIIWHSIWVSGSSFITAGYSKPSRCQRWRDAAGSDAEFDHRAPAARLLESAAVYYNSGRVHSLQLARQWVTYIQPQMSLLSLKQYNTWWRQLTYHADVWVWHTQLECCYCPA